MPLFRTFPRIIKLETSSASLAVSAGTLVAWDTEAINIGGIFTRVNSNLEIQVAVAGYYQIITHLLSTVNDGNARSAVIAKSNNAIRLAKTSWGGTATDSIPAQATVLLAANDTIGAQYNFATTVSNIAGTAGFSYLQIIKLPYS